MASVVLGCDLHIMSQFSWTCHDSAPV